MNDNDSPSNHSLSQPGPSSSGLRLLIPPLKALKELNSKKGRNSPLLEDAGVKKIPRPIKLKPLKEVLTTLITKIKKSVPRSLSMLQHFTSSNRKDAYAFFLRPVDISQVPGYTDLIKRPMDFGTMATKVEKNKYRSLEEFSVCTSELAFSILLI